MRTTPRVALSSFASTRFSAVQVNTPCGIAGGGRAGGRRAARLALPGAEVYGESGGEDPAAFRRGGAERHQREGDMSWTKPAFEEIKMDAEAKSYSDGIIW